MTRFLFSLLIITSLFAVSCNDTKSSKKKNSDKEDVVKDEDKDKEPKKEDDAQKAADELCDCLTAKAKTVSADLKKILTKVGESETPVATYQKEFAKLEPDEQRTLEEEVSEFIKIDAVSVPECSKKVANYVVKGKDKEERQKRILQVMRENSSCEIGTAQWALAMEKMYGTGRNKYEVEESNDEETSHERKRK